MAYHFVPASSQSFLEGSLAGSTWDSDFSTAIRCRFTGAGTATNIMSCVGAGNGWGLNLTAAGRLDVFYRSAAEYPAIAGPFPTGWATLVFCKGASDADVVLNGAATNIATASANKPTTSPGYAVGASALDLTDSTFAGDMCEFAIWNARLSVAEAKQYAAGFSPLQIRPGSLIRYLPLVSALGDLKSGAKIGTSASPPTVTTHAAVISPRRNRAIFVPAAGGASFKPAWARGSNVMPSGGYFS